MSQMKNFLRLLLLSIAIPPAMSISTAASPQHYEIRSYVLGDQSDAEAIHAYLRDAFLPAMNRLKVGPIGVFHNSS